MKKIIIIGAGPAGITAAYELLRKSEEYTVIVLEESDEIGGISRTVKHNGYRMDIGGHRFFSKDKRVIHWWNEIMPLQGQPSFDDIKLNRNTKLTKGGPDPEKMDQVMLVRNRVSRIYYKQHFFDYPVKMNANTIRSMGFLTTLQAGFSYLFSTIHKRKENSLENFYINRFGKKLYSMFFEGYTEKLWGRHPRVISPDWGAQRVKGLSILAIIKDVFSKLFLSNHKQVETSLIEEFCYPKYGPGQLWETAAEEVIKMGGVIRKNSKVEKITTEGNHAKSVTYISNGQSITEHADYIISSMPIKDLINGMNEVPAEIMKYADGLPYRDFVTIGLSVKSLNLKNKTKLKTLGNIIPDCWIYVQDTGVKLGRIQIFNNWSPYLVKNPEETVWIGLEYFCNEGDSYWNMNEKEWMNLGIEELLKMNVISEKNTIMDFHVEKVKKAYPAYFDTYEKIDDIILYLNQFENLYCVGRNGQHRYNNMDHSMVTSFEVVQNIMSDKKTKDNIWNVNTEKEYHETNHKGV